VGVDRPRPRVQGSRRLRSLPTEGSAGTADSAGSWAPAFSPRLGFGIPVGDLDPLDPRNAATSDAEISLKEMSSRIRVLDQATSRDRPPRGTGHGADQGHVHHRLHGCGAAGHPHDWSDDRTRATPPTRLPQRRTSVLKLPTTARRSEAGRSLTVEQANQFLESIAEHRHHTLWRLMLTTGLRPGEATGLTWSDIDFDEGRNQVRRSLKLAHGQLRLTDTSCRPPSMTPWRWRGARLRMSASGVRSDPTLAKCWRRASSEPMNSPTTSHSPTSANRQSDTHSASRNAHRSPSESDRPAQVRHLCERRSAHNRGPHHEAGGRHVASRNISFLA
jgi:hypothetical protein